MASAEVINIEIKPNIIEPCISITRGIYIGALQGANYNVSFIFAYKANGVRIRVGPVLQPILGMTFVQLIDYLHVQVETQVQIQANQMPDSNQMMSCVSSLIAIDSNNQQVPIDNPSYTQHYIP
jgi:hypothetical protein